MPRARIVRADRTLPHQIRLDFVSGQHAYIAVKCNCRGEHPLGVIACADDPWPIYNDPTNHNNRGVPFVARAHHTETQEVYFVD